MGSSRRASADDYARRVNKAGDLLRSGTSVVEAVTQLAQTYAISLRQARRYVQVAQEAGTTVPVPDAKVVFTVKLPTGLVTRLRRLAEAEHKTLSELVGLALEELLQRRSGGPSGSAQAD